MTHRGLYLCAEDTCQQSPDIWRNGFGLCHKHAVAANWIELSTRSASVPIIKKSLLQELLDEINNGPPKPRYWWDDHPNDDPF